MIRRVMITAITEAMDTGSENENKPDIKIKENWDKELQLIF